MGGGEFPGRLEGLAQGPGIDILQGDLAARQGLAGEYVTEGAAPELRTAGAYQCDFHFIAPSIMPLMM